MTRRTAELRHFLHFHFQKRPRHKENRNDPSSSRGDRSENNGAAVKYMKGPRYRKKTMAVIIVDP
jgi:hypothetical protein